MKISFANPEEEISQKMNNVFRVTDCFIKVIPGNVILPKKYEELAEPIRNLPVYEDDTWLISYPRTGSTWAQEMIWLLVNNLDYEGAKEILQKRCPLLELTALFSGDHFEWVTTAFGSTVEYVRSMPRPRLIRSHLPLQLLPKDLETVRPKIIYTARNPKDLCVSFFYYCKLVHGLVGGFDDFCELFLKDSVPLGPYWNHVIPFWQRRNDPNILFLKYEDMSHDLMDVIRKCANFLEVGYTISEENLLRICEHLKFDKMQANPAVNLEPFIDHWNKEFKVESENKSESENKNGNIREMKFIRKGKIGDWKNNISAELSEKFDEMIKIRFNGTGLVFQYE